MAVQIQKAGRIIEINDFPEARKPAYKLLFDFGEDIGTRKHSAQTTEHYFPENLLGRKIVAAANFPSKQLDPFMSECLVTGFYREDGVVLVSPDKPVPNGAKLG
ncbi:tRNA-binding protein [Alteromonas sp. 76-1]|nr:tRNA-binding protein [Alteromonas sp. 76-1]VEL98197.1 tRNA-binding protein [Alteromonas sp. 76-1]